jgi:hypothetical protein
LVIVRLATPRCRTISGLTLANSGLKERLFKLLEVNATIAFAMSRVAIVIGVNRCGPLPILRGAINGANRMADWAREHEFQVIPLIDSDQAPLTAGKIFETVDGIVHRRNVRTLLIFFAGHGVLLAPECEYWLLPGAHRNPNEAVNLLGSVEAARNSGIEHIVFISDACRSRAAADWQTGVKGTVIFPTQSARSPRPAIDRLFATLPGNPALELDVGTATRVYDGIFTDCLLDVLNAEVEDTIDEFDSPPPPIRVIQCFRAGEHLQAEVPRRLADADPRLNQTPDYIAESHRPKYLILVGPAEGDFGLSAPPSPPQPRPTPLIERAAAYDLDHYFERQDGLSVGSRPPIQDSQFSSDVDRIQSARGRDTFETRVGFTVLGTSVERAATAGPIDTFETNGDWHIRVYNEHAHTGLVEFTNESGVALPVLPGFVGTVLVQENEILSIAYAPAVGTRRYAEYDRLEVEKRRAFASAAMSHGYFRINAASAPRFAGYVRGLKSFDPILGLFAAYAYSQAGLQDQVEDVYRYMADEDVPMLLDVAMLANKWEKPVAPFCPLLRQSWAIGAAQDMPTVPLLEAVTPHLRPGLWTSFNRTGMNLLFAELNRGRLL